MKKTVLMATLVMLCCAMGTKSVAATDTPINSNTSTSYQTNSHEVYRQSTQKEIIAEAVNISTQYVTPAQSSITSYQNFNGTKRQTLSQGHRYETRTYYEVNGTRYYSLYTEVNHVRTWAGYVVEQDLQTLPFVSEKRKVVAVGNYKRYSNLFWKERGVATSGTYYETSGYYTINGTRYYSLYRYNSQGERGWYGYVNEHALKDIQPTKQKRKVTAIGNYKRYSDFFWKERGIATSGTYYETSGYYTINGTRYYSLYRNNSQGKRGGYGYVNEHALKDIQLTKQKRKVVTVGNYKRYSDFFWKERGVAKSGTYYETSGYYTMNGIRYYSLYRNNSQGKRGWYGYVNEHALKDIQLTKQKRKVTAIGNYKRYSDFFWKERGVAKSGTYYETSGYYTINGTRYYSLYRNNIQGKRGWYGYVNEHALSSVVAETLNKNMKVKNHNYTCWSNFFLNQKKSDLKNVNKVNVRYRYTMGDGTVYYSIYNNKKWLGYVNQKACHPYYYIKMNVPNYRQYDLGIPTGCEGVSLLEALHYQKQALSLTPLSFLSQIPKAKTPYQGFVGSPFISSPNLYTAIFSRPLAKWGQKYGRVVDLTGKKMWDLVSEVRKGNPVVAYVTINLRPLQWANWAFGRVPNNNHAMTIAGFDEEKEKIYVSDPISGKYWTPYYSFKTVYEARKMAVEVLKK